MPMFKLLVISDAVKGREDECNDWYNTTRLADALALPGFKSAQRFMTGRYDKDAPCGFTALCDVEADSLRT